MSGMKGSKLSRKSGRTDVTFQSLFNEWRYGLPEVGTHQVLFQLQGAKMAILGFNTVHTASGSGPGGATVDKTFFKNGIFRVPYAGEQAQFYLLIAYVWMNQLMNNPSRAWKSIQEFMRAPVTLNVLDYFVCFTETFDDCFREGAYKADRVNRERLARAVLGVMSKYDSHTVRDEDRLIRNTAMYEAHPRTIIFQDAVDNGKTYGDVLTMLLPYYATIYKDEYRCRDGRGKVTNEVTLLTKVEPWPAGVCGVGRKNCNRYVRKVYKHTDAQLAATTSVTDRLSKLSMAQAPRSTALPATGEPELTVNKGDVPYLLGDARNSRGAALEFKAMCKLPARGSEQPFYAFQEGGAGNSFTMRNNVSACVIGGLGSSPTKGGTPLKQRIVVIDGGHERTDVKAGAVTFHPVYLDGNGKARVQLIGKPFSAKVGQPFIVDAIKQRSSYAGCAGVCINGKKSADDGLASDKVTWALQTIAAVA